MEKKKKAREYFNKYLTDVQQEIPSGLFKPKEGVHVPLKKKIKKKKPKIKYSDESEPDISEELKLKPLRKADSLTKEGNGKSINDKIKDLEKEFEEELNKDIEIPFFFYDGFQDRKTVVCKKETTVGEFLELARHIICREYPKYTNIKGERIFMLVYGQSIIPNEYSFFDLQLAIKKGNLDENMDYKKTKTEVLLLDNNKIKIIDKGTFEEHKHIFPFKNWVEYKSM